LEAVSGAARTNLTPLFLVGPTFSPAPGRTSLHLISRSFWRAPPGAFCSNSIFPSFPLQDFPVDFPVFLLTMSVAVTTWSATCFFFSPFHLFFFPFFSFPVRLFPFFNPSNVPPLSTPPRLCAFARLQLTRQNISFLPPAFPFNFFFFHPPPLCILSPPFVPLRQTFFLRPLSFFVGDSFFPFIGSRCRPAFGRLFPSPRACSGAGRTLAGFVSSPPNVFHIPWARESSLAF